LTYIDFEFSAVWFTYWRSAMGWDWQKSRQLPTGLHLSNMGNPWIGV